VQFEAQRAVLAVLLDPQSPTARSEALAKLAALRELAAAIPDQASLPRIDAAMAAIDLDAERAKAAWQRANEAMIARDFRPADTAVLLRALKSPFAMPPPVDDAVVETMRSYANRVLKLTGEAIAARTR
jgi:hypothetical protein